MLCMLVHCSKHCSYALMPLSRHLLHGCQLLRLCAQLLSAAVPGGNRLLHVLFQLAHAILRLLALEHQGIFDPLYATLRSLGL